ncbi:MAG TPA: hypothetical protein VLU43_03010 [Anaeromyxobacteraceae bacterium]|nr:hypothetical protein [Anaeromyxobacteraceae bacterium]
MPGESACEGAPRFRIARRRVWRDAAVVALWLGLSVAFVADVATPAPEASAGAVRALVAARPAVGARRASVPRAAAEPCPCPSACPVN